MNSRSVEIELSVMDSLLMSVIANLIHLDLRVSCYTMRYAWFTGLVLKPFASVSYIFYSVIL